MKIAERTVASFHYTLTNTAGEVLDSSAGGDPLPYLHGAGNIVPGLENAMTGRVAGDKFDVVVTPEEGYGVPVQEMIQVVPRSAFAGVDNLAVGMQFQAETGQGPLGVTITAIEGDNVTVDGNHPLAGQALQFAVEVVEVREATVEEALHGHVHGAGGHNH
ncbi:MAG: peptidylprolyl isomerase [Dokdonella sp.]